MDSLRQVWTKSKVFRVILIIALIYASLRLAAQVYLATQRMLPGQSETQIIPNDLQDYFNAGVRLENHQPLYPPTDEMEFYQYPPVFALAIRPLLWLPPTVSFEISFILRLLGYCVLFFWWERIFRRTGIKRCAEIWAWTLPIWAVFSAFWSDLAYMNIYLITAMFATLLIDAVLSENLILSVLWLTILLQTKPQWAFALAVPLLLGRWKFFLKLLLSSAVINTIIIGIFLLIVGPAYGWQQHLDFVHFLVSMNNNFPWREPTSGFLGYNHSITQIIIYLLGKSANSFHLAILLKILFLVPLAIVCVRNILHPARQPGYQVPELALGLVFALYLGVFIWMDMVWEISLGCAVFAFLLAIQNRDKLSSILIWLVFIPYALIDLWQLGSYAILGDAIISPNDYVLTDYSIYIPIIMMVILVFYGILIKRLWSLSVNSNMPAVNQHTRGKK